jgi:hypothetical protein
MKASCPVFMFCAPEHVFGGAEVVRSCFLVLRARTRFRRNRGRRLPFSCFALPNSFSTTPGASSPVFMFCAPGHIFGSTEGVGSQFHILRSRTRFRRYRGRWVPFSCFARPKSFSAVLRASGPVLKYCAPGLVFGGTEGVGYRFHVLHARNHFRRSRFPILRSRARFQWCRFHVLCSLARFRSCGGRRVPFSCFALPDAFWAVPRVSVPVFKFCAPELVFAGTEGDGYRFLIFRARNNFRQHRGRRVLFSCFARPHSLSAEPRALTLVFMVGAHGLVLTVPKASGPFFMFRRYRGRRDLFSYFALPDSFLAVRRALGTVSPFCAPGIFFAVPRTSCPIFMFWRYGGR